MKTLLVLAAALLAASCAHPAPQTSPQAAGFFDGLGALCGQAFEGEVIANEPAAPNDPFVGRRLVMHVRTCSADTIRIPLHVGADRSRTWVVTRLADGRGLRLKHDHRHEDGSADAVTQYGGETLTATAGARQEFPADAESREVFTREGLLVSLPNVWAIEHAPGESFVYELARPGRLFRVRFDLTRPVDPPPAPWGAD